VCRELLLRGEKHDANEIRMSRRTGTEGLGLQGKVVKLILPFARKAKLHEQENVFDCPADRNAVTYLEYPRHVEVRLYPAIRMARDS
jgi:hypothetical protein